ncbi:hypothetical protein GCM10009783_07390 [Glycomyces lechevalierae]
MDSSPEGERTLQVVFDLRIGCSVRRAAAIFRVQEERSLREFDARAMADTHQGAVAMMLGDLAEHSEIEPHARRSTAGRDRIASNRIRTRSLPLSLFITPSPRRPSPGSGNGL